MMRLTVEDLACVRGGRPVFAGVSFAVAAGEAVVVLGRNGAGKSSLLRVLAGLLPAATGRIVLDGGDAEASLAEQAHYVGHLDAQKASLTVTENLDFWTAFLGGDRARVPVALESVGLGSLAGLPAAHLSAGQRRRLSLARLLTARRPVWLLDEPTAALDVAGQDLLAGLMREQLASGGLIVAATHAPLGLTGRELRLDGSRMMPPEGASA